VVVFHGARGGPRTTPDWSVSSGFAADGFGAAVGGAGDVNGDGFADLVVGAPLDDQAGLDSGRVYLYYGSQSGLAGSPGWVRHFPLTARDRFSSDLEAYFGCSVASAGDVNGDGFSDVVVGANFAEVDDINEGVAVVFLGSAAGLRFEPHWIGQPNERFAAYGSSVAGVGDVDGDGYDDVLVGAPQASDDQHFEGLAALYRGSRQGLSAEPVWTAESDRTDDTLGDIVVGAGDINGDGFADAAIAVPGYRDARGRVGQVWIKYGSPRGFSGSSEWRLSKPRLVAWQQRWDRAGLGQRATWVGMGLASVLGVFGLAWAWHRGQVQKTAEASRRLARREAARDLHDDLGPPLAALSASLANTGDADERREAQQQVDALGEVVDRLTRQWKSEAPDLGATVDALLASARRLAEAGGLGVQTEVGELSDAAMLSAEGERHIAACLKEAVANVLRHAHAQRIVLRAVQSAPGRLQIEIEDDGRGGATLDPGPGHDGLGNLTSRMKELGGRCEIASEPDQGTLVILEVPTVAVPRASASGGILRK
jgi:two-component sensor histidine kinase